MPEEKFEPIILGAEHVAALRRQMDQRVDARALAAEFIAARAPMDQARVAALAEVGIDGTRTLTEIEGVDLGDGHKVADEAEAHALRHVPLALWKTFDIHLMLLYGHGGGTTLALALHVLEQDPLIEATYYPGDLLAVAARAAADDPALPDGMAGRTAMTRVLGAASEALRASFDRCVQALDLDAFEAEEGWRLLAGGLLDAGDDRFRDQVEISNLVAEARERIAPAPVLLQASAELVYSRHRGFMEIVSPSTFADPAVRAMLELPGNVWFRRATALNISRTDEDEVRLRHVAAGALENWHGVAFADPGAAMAHAERNFGVARAAWQPVAVGDR